MIRSNRLSQAHQLDWTISYNNRPGEPKAFQLIKENGIPIEWMVIGENYRQAEDTISLANLLKKRRL